MYCFAKVCRFCLSSNKLVHYGARDKHNIKFYQKIRMLFPKLINKTSQHFPIWICTNCQEQVNQSYEFKQKCYKTYKLLKKYSVQLYEANKEKNIPDVPTEIFQEVKPKIDKNVIAIEDEDQTENYYNAGDITIVKNELLPNCLKNEPEFHNMIQSIIDNNFETIRQIDGDRNSINFKSEQINASNSERSIQEEEVSTANIPENNNETVHTNNLIFSSTDLENGNNNTIDVLDSATFTLDYTNASFEKFASHVASVINVSETVPESVAELNAVNEDSTMENVPNSSTRVLRRRKSVCYRNIEKRSDTSLDKLAEKGENESISTMQINQTMPAVKQITERKKKLNTSVYDQSLLSPVEISSQRTETHLRKIINKKQRSIMRDSELIQKVIKEHKLKFGRYNCDKCSKEYVRYAQFSSHISKCEGNVRPQCKVCQKFFSSPGNLRRHSYLHLKIMKFRCLFCQSQYSQKGAMTRHMRMKHNYSANKTSPFC